MAEKIALGADHGGYKLKETIKTVLAGLGFKVEDSGTDSEDPCDYPRYGYDAAGKVSSGKAKKGILICKSGIGMSIIANKLPGVRAGLCANEAEAVSSREHNDANVLVLSANKLTPRKAEAIVSAWLKTPALKGRHARRVRQIREIERRLYKMRRGK
ncbi:MAG: ribose 5-phosphate isomerase B [Candidatus Omnitrophica bacterium]|nr:ribose 5-phosphate isomerase B [Candidatus Omnitrophota bacterium]